MVRMRHYVMVAILTIVVAVGGRNENENYGEFPHRQRDMRLLQGGGQLAGGGPGGGPSGGQGPGSSPNNGASGGGINGLTTAGPSIAPSTLPTAHPSSVPSAYPTLTPSSSPTFDSNVTYDAFVNSNYITSHNFQHGYFILDGLPYWMNRRQNAFLSGDVICLLDSTCKIDEGCRYQCHVLSKDELTNGDSTWKTKIFSSDFQPAKSLEDVLKVNGQPAGQVKANRHKVAVYAENKLFPGDRVCLESPEWRYMQQPCTACKPFCRILTNEDLPDGPSKTVLLRRENSVSVS